MGEQLTCELNGIKYLKMSAMYPANNIGLDNISKTIDKINISGGVCIGVNANYPFLGKSTISLSFLIPEHKVIEFSKETF